MHVARTADHDQGQRSASALPIGRAVRMELRGGLLDADGLRIGGCHGVAQAGEVLERVSHTHCCEAGGELARGIGHHRRGEPEAPPLVLDESVDADHVGDGARSTFTPADLSSWPVARPWA